MGSVYTTVEIDPNYNRKTKPNKTGAYPVHIVIRQVRKKASIIPKIPNIPLALFQPIENKWVKKEFVNHRGINAIISKIKNKLDTYILQSQLNGFETSPGSVKEWYQENYSTEGNRIDKSGETFLQYSTRFIKQRNKSRANYELAFKKVEKYNGKSTFDNLDRNFFKGLAYFLENNSKEKVNGSTAREYFNKIKVVYREWCRELNFPFNDTLFDRITFDKTPVRKKRSLTWDQLKLLENLKFGTNVREQKRELMRDLFLFLCYTSRHYKEIKDLTFEENFYFENDNPDFPVFFGKREKTGARFENPLFPDKLREIFDKYHPEKKGRFFPQVPYYYVKNPSMSINSLFDELGKLIGLDFPLNIRVARYTFRTTIASKLPALLVQRIMGHTRIQTQNEYLALNSNIYRELIGSWGNE